MCWSVSVDWLDYGLTCPICLPFVFLFNRVAGHCRCSIVKTWILLCSPQGRLSLFKQAVKLLADQLKYHRLLCFALSVLPVTSQDTSSCLGNRSLRVKPGSYIFSEEPEAFLRPLEHVGSFWSWSASYECFSCCFPQDPWTRGSQFRQQMWCLFAHLGFDPPWLPHLGDFLPQFSATLAGLYPDQQGCAFAFWVPSAVAQGCPALMG